MALRSNMAFVVLAFTVALTIGCGSSGDIGYVSGTVTQNGEPLTDATVTFYPTGARGSVGRTDENGKYVLLHTRDTDGATIGQHRVTISTQVFAEVSRSSGGYGGEGAVQESVVRKGQRETMPPKYLDPKQTVLTATVSAGSNVIDFDLE